MKRVTIWIALLACAAVLLLVPIGCGGDDDDGSGNAPAETTEETHPEETTEG